MPVITLLSDFNSLYPAQMKGVILNINPEVRLVDITHDIPPQDIRTGAFALMVSAPHFPIGTIHLAVVDPGVGTLRCPIVIESGGHLFVGPDNGLLVPAARRMSGDFTARHITNSDLFLDVSSTFHGRDIFAPVAAHLSAGMVTSEVGDFVSDYVELDFGNPTIDGGKVSGRIIYVDGFGNLITNIPGELILEKAGHIDVLSVGDVMIPMVHTFADVDLGSPLVLVGSHGYVEIAVNSGSAARLLGIGSGDGVEVELP